MYVKTMIYMQDLARRFRDDEDGLALTEYLVLLGLLTATLIGAITAFGDGLETTWDAWTTWITANLGAPVTPQP
ncbi:Flp family type IVb pilin [Roseovarius autotrophicus]|uniref:Flp family type IVb pilin n=1 Tax=Roseovarius autotrophicus TaxID=2824121 RepID=UPI001B382F4A|nr:Flp family type IVb pilin [Roseovarius autotrophicus]